MSKKSITKPPKSMILQVFDKTPTGFAFSLNFDKLQEQLSAHAFKENPDALTSAGFVSPFANSEMMYAGIGKGALVALRIDSKVIPEAEIEARIQKREKVIREEEHRLVRAGDRRDIRDEVLQELIPQAMHKSVTIEAMILPHIGMVAVFTSEAGTADRMLHMMRKALESLPCRKIELRNNVTHSDTGEQFTKPNPEEVFKKLLVSECDDLPFSLGNDLSMKGDFGRFAVANTELDGYSETIKDLLEQGGTVNKLSLYLPNQMYFSINPKLVISGISWCKPVVVPEGNVTAEDLDEEEEENRRLNVEKEASLHLIADGIAALKTDVLLHLADEIHATKKEL